MKNKITILLILAIGLGVVNFIWLLTLQNRDKGPLALPEKMKLRGLDIVNANGTEVIRLYSMGGYSAGIVFLGPDGNMITLSNLDNYPSILIKDADHITTIDPGGVDTGK